MIRFFSFKLPVCFIGQPWLKGSTLILPMPSKLGPRSKSSWQQDWWNNRYFKFHPHFWPCLISLHSPRLRISKWVYEAYASKLPGVLIKSAEFQAHVRPTIRTSTFFNFLDLVRHSKFWGNWEGSALEILHLTAWWTWVDHLLSQSPQASLRSQIDVLGEMNTETLLQLAGFPRDEIRKHQVLLGIGELKFSGLIETNF